MYNSAWDDKQVVEDGSALLWRVVAKSMHKLWVAGCRLLVWWVPGHTDRAMDKHVVQDLCDSLCSGLEGSDWLLLHGPCMLFMNDDMATLCCLEMGWCMNEIKSWLEAGQWKVLQEMWGKAKWALVWEVSWHEVAGLLEGSSLALLQPVALETCCKGKVAKSVVAECDVSQLLLLIPFDLHWAQAVNRQLSSSVALDTTAQAGPCLSSLVCKDCHCTGLDVPQHLFEDDGCTCDLMEGSAVFLQLSASVWFQHRTPLLLDLGVCLEPLGWPGFHSGFAAEVKQAQLALPLPEVHVTQWETAFAHKHNNFEKLEAQKEWQNDCQLHAGDTALRVRTSR